MTRLFLLFHGRFPSEKAAALFAAKSAESFVKAGINVTLVVPERKGVDKGDPFSFYSIENNFKVTYLPTIDIFNISGLNFLAFWLSFIAFSFSVRKHLRKESGQDDIIYSNESLPLYFASFVRKNCFYEMHDFPESKIWFFGKFLARMKWILVHNKWKLEEVKKLFPQIMPTRYIYEPNAVEMKAFDIVMEKEEARRKLSIPLDKKIAVYTGHLYGWKGTDTLAIAAQSLPPEFIVAFVGGTPADIDDFKKKYGSNKNIHIAGFRPHREMPLWQKAADVLVLPNTAKEKISAYYTSPMKLFEYMASKRPIIASDIPSIREIVGPEDAYLVPADDPQALAKAIEDSVSDTNSAKLYEHAYRKVLYHTWDKRAHRIIDFIKR